MTSNTSAYYLPVKAPWGQLSVAIQDDVIIEVDLVPDRSAESSSVEHAPSSQFLKRINQQFNEYFSNPDHSIDLPTRVEGTSFQLRLWTLLREIKPGSVLTYAEAAEKIGSGARAIGNACRANPLPIIVPCHRIVAKNGIGGFAGKIDGDRISMKQWLLAHEGVRR